MKIRLIKNEEDYGTTLSRVNDLMDTNLDKDGLDELETLAVLVEKYEEEQYPIEIPSAIGAIKFRMDQSELTQRDLVPYIGSRAKVSEILSGKRSLTLKMIRALNQYLGIPAEVLLQEDGGEIPENMVGIDWNRFPILEMARLNFIESKKNLHDCAEEVIRGMIKNIGGPSALPAGLFRKTTNARLNTKMDMYALKAWSLYVLSTAKNTKLKGKFVDTSVTQDFLKDVARLSFLGDGPKLAVEHLSKHGIHLIYAPHLSKTYLDGAVFMLPSGAPVIGLTIRYDRIDNFWFTLLHELAHLGRHFKGKDTGSFFDDHSLRKESKLNEDDQEFEADEWAENALISIKDWEDLNKSGIPSVGRVLDLSLKSSIHPAIIAGRIRYENKNYRLMSHFVGSGEVKKHFI
jgi:HTH-type transcriptional regulator / antitoxin HigA